MAAPYDRDAFERAHVKLERAPATLRASDISALRVVDDALADRAVEALACGLDTPPARNAVNMTRTLPTLDTVAKGVATVVLLSERKVLGVIAELRAKVDAQQAELLALRAEIAARAHRRVVARGVIHRAQPGNASRQRVDRAHSDVGAALLSRRVAAHDQTGSRRKGRPMRTLDREPTLTLRNRAQVTSAACWLLDSLRRTGWSVRVDEDEQLVIEHPHALMHPDVAHCCATLHDELIALVQDGPATCTESPAASRGAFYTPRMPSRGRPRKRAGERKISLSTSLTTRAYDQLAAIARRRDEPLSALVRKVLTSALGDAERSKLP